MIKKSLVSKRMRGKDVMVVENDIPKVLKDPTRHNRSKFRPTLFHKKGNSSRIGSIVIRESKRTFGILCKSKQTNCKNFLVKLQQLL